jgi:hypothetical protein
MHTYEIEFTWQGQRYSETVRASSTFAARKLILTRYPGANIWNIRQK